MAQSTAMPHGQAARARAWGPLGMASLTWVACTAACAQSVPVVGADLREQANAVLTIMSYQVVPDATVSSLAITSASSGNPGLDMAQVGGGLTLRGDLPRYLEGLLAASRYNPSFVVNYNGQAFRIPVKWDGVTATGGVGWDFPVWPHLVVRPILDVVVGHIASELTLASLPFRRDSGGASDFLVDGRLTVGGLGGALMLEYSDHEPRDELDASLRYTSIGLRSTSASNAALEGNADASTIGAWIRWRRPTGLAALDRPLRFLVEAAHSEYVGSQRGALGFDRLTSVGAGLELDISARDLWFERARLVVRHLMGEHTSGTSIGLAAGF
jgi:hypothetical protein